MNGVGTSSGRRRELGKDEGRDRLERRATEGQGPTPALVGREGAREGVRKWEGEHAGSLKALNLSWPEGLPESTIGEGR